MSSLKRLAAQEPGVEEEECLVRESKRRPTFLNIARKVMELKHMQGLSLQLEPFLRQVVREEIQKGLSHFVYSASRPLLKCIRPSIATCWRLTFKSKLPDTLFTGSRIESEDGTPVTIAIENSNSEMIMASSPLSSVRIEIVVIDSDFYCDEQEDWTEKEFNANVVRARDGKRPLLTGDLVVTLRGGIGKFGDVIFTDNSSWIRSRKFRLGARMLPSKFTEERIQEAVSGTFFVKDHRGALCSKHHPPSLHDEVWRLEKIWKDGAFHKRLSEKGIDTVREFLKFLVMDQNYLRSILGNGMSNKVWEAITEHARECQSDKKFYSYYIAEDQVTLVFDSVFQVAGVKFDGYDYQTISSLTAARMALVNRLKQLAYRNWNNIIEIDAVPVGAIPRPLPMADASIPGSRLLDLPSPDFRATIGDEQITHVGLGHSFDPPFQPELPEGPLQLNHNSIGHDATPLQLLTSNLSSSSFYTRNSYTSRPGDHGAEPSTSGRRPLTGETFLSFDSDVGTSSYFQQQAFPWDSGSSRFQVSDCEVHGCYVPPVPDFDLQVSPSGWVKAPQLPKAPWSALQALPSVKLSKT